MMGRSSMFWTAAISAAILLAGVDSSWGQSSENATAGPGQKLILTYRHQAGSEGGPGAEGTTGSASGSSGSGGGSENTSSSGHTSSSALGEPQGSSGGGGNDSTPSRRSGGIVPVLECVPQCDSDSTIDSNRDVSIKDELPDFDDDESPEAATDNSGIPGEDAKTNAVPPDKPISDDANSLGKDEATEIVVSYEVAVTPYVSGGESTGYTASIVVEDSTLDIPDRLPKDVAQSVRDEAAALKDALASWQERLSPEEASRLEGEGTVQKELVGPFQGLALLQLETPSAITLALPVDTRPPEISFLDADGNEVSGDLAYGKPFMVQLRFIRQRAEGTLSVTLSVGGGEERQVAVKKIPDSPDTYRSEPITLGGVKTGLQ